MLNPTQNEALAGFARAAVRSERQYGVPAEISVAQAAIESKWGAKMPGNNCLGIKANHRVKDSQSFATHEVEGGVRKAQTLAFAAYDSIDGCFEDHAILLSQESPYSAMLTKFQQSENLPAYVEEVAHKYATDDSYAKLILAVISMRPVQDALRAARAAAPEETKNA